MDLQRRHDALNQDAQHTQRALACSQVYPRMHITSAASSAVNSLMVAKGIMFTPCDAMDLPRWPFSNTGS